jgi:hypothetical protein
MSMDRLAARKRRYAPDQTVLETSLRSRTARAARACLRRMQPVVVLAPRWSAVPRFLEELSLDLAVGEPAIGCRTVDFRPLQGRPVNECWQTTLQLMGQLGKRGWRPSTPLSVADRRGFRWALEQVIEQAHIEAPNPVALLASSVDSLPLEVLEDLGQAWQDYRKRHPEDQRCGLLMAASASARWLRIGDAPQLQLADFGQTEAAAAIVGRAGPLPMQDLELVSRFTGGIPSLVDAAGRHAEREGGLPRSREELLGCFGGLVDEMRGAIEIVEAHDLLADRLQSLLDGEALPREEAVDRPLLLSGLVRPERRRGQDIVRLRAPAIASMVG